MGQNQVGGQEKGTVTGVEEEPQWEYVSTQFTVLGEEKLSSKFSVSCDPN